MQNPIEPNLLVSLVWTILLLATAQIIGWFLIPRRAIGEGWLGVSGVQLTAGLIALAGIFATWGLQRSSYMTLIPVLLLGFAALNWRGAVRADRLVRPFGDLITKTVLVLATFFATVLWHWWMRADGHITPLNMDLAWFAQLAHSIPEAGAMTHWAATLGSASQAVGEGRDVWYHWSPIWLTYGVSRMSGISELNALLFIVGPVCDITLVVAAGALVSRYTAWRDAWNVCAGAAMIIALTFPSMAEIVALSKLTPFGVSPHIHTSLAYQFSYKVEACLMLSALLCWRDQKVLVAALLLFIACLSAPHTVAGSCVIGGTLAGIGVLKRDKGMMGLGACVVGMALFTWVVLHFVFGTDLPKSDGAKFIDLTPVALLQNLGRSLGDSLIAAALALILLPGLWHFLRCKDSGARMLGWIAVAALAGSMVAFHVLLPEGDRAHFVLYAYAFFVIPIGILGLAAINRPWSIGLILLATGIGLYDMGQARYNGSPTAYTTTDLTHVKEQLNGRAFGYFAESDRNWWISAQSQLAGHLGTRCVRLNRIKAMDYGTDAARFYGSTQPEQLLPRLPDETDNGWALRFARRLGLRCIIATSTTVIPNEVLQQLRPLFVSPGISLFELRE